jgi:hypothetical protein
MDQDSAQSTDFGRDMNRHARKGTRLPAGNEGRRNPRKCNGIGGWSQDQTRQVL